MAGDHFQPVIRIIIFGTGTSGQRVWRAVGGFTDVEVVAFADNDPHKHGVEFSGKPVVPPTTLGDLPWDYVVLASQWAGDIAAQLETLGVVRSRILVPSLATVRDDLDRLLQEARAARPISLGQGRSIARTELPHVLILTHETLNDSHGTGVVLRRYFRDFPSSHLCSICHLETGKPAIQNSIVLKGLADQTSTRVLTELHQRSFAPDLVYATAFNENDLPVLEAVLDALPDGTPVIQHFMDYMPHDPAAFDARFRKLLPRLSSVWALTESLASLLAEKLFTQVEHVSCLHQALPTRWRTEHLPYRDGFRTVLLGNPWQPWIIPFLADVWRRCRTELSGLLPIEWYCHPLRVQALIDAGYDPGFEVVWRGFIPDLQERLRSADLAIIAFNFEPCVVNHYARSSVPSRITELAAAGLPIFGIASPDSGLAGFMAARGLGQTVAGPDASAVARSLCEFIRDRDRRAAAGRAARMVAEREFRLEPFQEWLVGQLLDHTQQWRERSRPTDRSRWDPPSGSKQVARSPANSDVNAS